MMDNERIIETAIDREEHAANVQSEIDDWKDILRGFPTPITIHPKSNKRRYGHWD